MGGSVRKILAINGSHRGERGLTHVLVEQMRIGAEEDGSGFETVVLANQKINQCLGCEVCHTEKSYLRCVFEDKDDVKSIQDRMSEADIIVYATPIYVFTMSGLMKRFIDRMNSTGDTGKLRVSKKGLFFHHIDPAVCSKPFVLVTVCGNIEDETSRNAVSYFRTFSRFMDAPMVGQLVRTSAFLLHTKDEKDLPKKREILEAFRQAGKELATSGAIAGRTKRQATKNVIEMPSIIRLLMKVRPLRSRLVEEGLKKGAIHFR
jgi:multimeric flavodoxin WrbA